MAARAFFFFDAANFFICERALPFFSLKCSAAQERFLVLACSHGKGPSW